MSSPWNKGKRLPPDPMTVDEAAAIVASIKTRYKTGARNAAHLTVLYRAGLRIQESCDLDISDYRESEQGKSLRVVRPKGSRRGAPPRELLIDPATVDLLDQWVLRRGLEPGPLFVTCSGKKVTREYIGQLLRRKAKELGITRRVHPHGFRHTFARELDAEGVSVEVVRKLLGHTSLATTQRYLETVGAVSALQGRDWNARQ